MRIGAWVNQLRIDLIIIFYLYFSECLWMDGNFKYLLQSFGFGLVSITIFSFFFDYSSTDSHVSGGFFTGFYLFTNLLCPNKYFCRKIPGFNDESMEFNIFCDYFPLFWIKVGDSYWLTFSDSSTLSNDFLFRFTRYCWIFSAFYWRSGSNFNGTLMSVNF